MTAIMHSPFLPVTMIDDLIADATANPRRRQHRNIHSSYADPSQRFFNALCRDSYIAPHRHSGTSDEETLIAIRGSFLAVLFEDDGSIAQVDRCGEGDQNVGAVIPTGHWHTIVPLSETAVIFEVKAGPFDPQRAKEFASWAPAENDPAASDYRMHLEARCTAWLTETAKTGRKSDGAAPERH